LIIRGNSKDSPAETLDKTTLKVLSFALEIRVGTTTIKCNAVDNKVREATNIRTSRGTALRPAKGLVVISKIVKEAP
jgi:hypothetical protein